MKTAVANRAEETQTCFTSSQLLPANQFLRAPKAWNYLKEKKKKREEKKKKAVHLMWSENGFGKKSWVEPWSELSSHVPKTALSPNCLGPNWLQNSHIRRNSSDHQKEARGKLAGEMATRNLLLTHYDPLWLSGWCWEQSVLPHQTERL